MERQYFFVFGAPRSGTTMLQMALNRHSRILIPPETHYFTLLLRSRRGQALHWRRIQKDLQIDCEAPTRRISPGDEANRYFTVLSEAYLSRFDRESVTHFGEKSPEHQRRVRLVQQSFPGSKCILIYRDGRDVALSLTKVPWMPHNLYLCFALWLHYYQLQKQILREFKDLIYPVRYEDLVRQPEREFRGILDFLGLEYEPSVALGSGNRDGVPGYELSYKGRAFEPITSERIANWPDELTAKQIAILERWGGSALTDLGYVLQNTEKTPIPLWHFPSLYARIAVWLGGRVVGQKCDELFGTCFNRANRITHPSYSDKMPVALLEK